MKPTPAPRPALGSHISLRQALSRRQFLRGTGIVLSLPLLDSMLPGISRAATANAAKEAAAEAPPHARGLQQSRARA